MYHKRLKVLSFFYSCLRYLFYFYTYFLMRFLYENLPFSFESFQEKFPDEFYVLQDHLQIDAEFLVEADQLKLISAHSGPVFIDAKSKLAYHQRFFQKHSVYKEPLARALGFKKGVSKPHVLDATAGMLGDSLLMYAMGAKVSAIERNPIAAALCLNCIRINKLPINFEWMDARSWEKEMQVIYFDPMYAQKNEKSKPKKEMQAFRDIVGPDQDAKEVALELLTKTSRLVIKRSVKSTPLLENPSITFNGKSTSYDVYLR